jgi:hypothetical protein
MLSCTRKASMGGIRHGGIITKSSRCYLTSAKGIGNKLKCRRDYSQGGGAWQSTSLLLHKEAVTGHRLFNGRLVHTRWLSSSDNKEGKEGSSSDFNWDQIPSASGGRQEDVENRQGNKDDTNVDQDAGAAVPADMDSNKELKESHTAVIRVDFLIIYLSAFVDECVDLYIYTYTYIHT